MKKSIVGIFTVVQLLAAAISARADSERELKIGFIAPLTGPRASMGEDARAAAELALTSISKRNPGLEITLQFEDSHGDPLKGIIAFQKLAQSGVHSVITQNSNVSLPISPLANRLQIVQLAITTTSDRFTTPRDFIFRTNGSTLAEARLMATAFQESSVGVITMRDEYPQMLSDHLMNELEIRGIKVTAAEEFLPNESDFRPLLTRIRSKSVKEVACLGYQVPCGLFVKQLRESGLKSVGVIVNTPVNNREFFTVAGPAAEGVIATYPLPDPFSAAAKEYLASTGREMNFFSSNAYDAVIILFEAARRCPEQISPKCLARTMNELGTIYGASGTKTFDENGDMTDTYELLRARNGRFEAGDREAVRAKW